MISMPYKKNFPQSLSIFKKNVWQGLIGKNNLGVSNVSKAAGKKVSDYCTSNILRTFRRKLKINLLCWWF